MRFKFTSFISFLLVGTCLMLISGSGFSQTGNLTWDGKLRDYRFHLPTNYNPANQYPLVFCLHGAGSDAFQQEFYSDFNTIADTANFIVCYPNGWTNTWNSGMTIPGASTEDDIGFINALLNQFDNTYSIDLSRVYATGMSNGGFMSQRLACELSHRLAAIASVAGQMNVSIRPTCNPGRPFPVMHLHGTLDLTVDYNGALDWIAVDSTIAFWVQNNNCTGQAVFSTLPNNAPLDGSTIEAYHYPSCDDDTEVLLYKILNGGHTWPGGPSFPFLGITNQDINGSEEIWKFFLRFKNDNATSQASEILEEWVTVSPNPFREVFEVKVPGQSSAMVWVRDLSGKTLLKREIKHGEVSIDLEGHSAGIYLLEIISEGNRSVTKMVKMD